MVQAQTVTKPHPHTERRAWYPLFAQAFSFPLDYHVISILDVTKTYATAIQSVQFLLIGVGN